MMKLTKKVALEVALSAIEANPIKEYHFAGSEEVFTAEEVKEKLMTIIDSLNTKANAPKKPTANQTANADLKAHLAEIMQGEQPKTISEMLTMSERFAGMSNQKLTSLVNQMVDDGVMVRTTEKRKAYFALAQG